MSAFSWSRTFVALRELDTDVPLLVAAREASPRGFYGRKADRAARTKTLKDTVNEALRRVAPNRQHRVARAFDTLSKAKLRDRSEAWR